MSTTTLPQIPGLGGLYGQALGRQAHAVLVRNKPSSALADVTLRVEGVQVGVDELTAYQHLIGEASTDELPAGFVHVLGFPLAMSIMVRSDFPLPVLGMVHIANTVTQQRPLRLEETLWVRAHARDLAAHRSGTQVDLVVDVGVDGSPQVLWQGVSTYLATGRRIAGLPEAQESPRPRDPQGWTPAGQWRLAGDIGRRYGAVSGDRNPIHLASIGAKAFGFKRAIAHGMYTAARALATIGAPDEPFAWTVEFGKPVLIPGTVTFGIRTEGHRHDYLGWDVKSGRVYFSGSVTPAP